MHRPDKFTSSSTKKHTGKRWKKMGPKEVNVRIDAKIKEGMEEVNRYLYGHLK